MGDRYATLLRIGDNWKDYPFSWESCRDLAGPLSLSKGGVPIALVSSGEKIVTPQVSTHSDPVRFVEIVISPSVDLVSIVETWIGVLVGSVDPPREPAKFNAHVLYAST